MTHSAGCMVMNANYTVRFPVPSNVVSTALFSAERYLILISLCKSVLLIVGFSVGNQTVSKSERERDLVVYMSIYFQLGKLVVMSTLQAAYLFSVACHRIGWCFSQ